MTADICIPTSAAQSTKCDGILLVLFHVLLRQIFFAKQSHFTRGGAMRPPQERP
jgi:hypothetical protein